MRTDDQIKIKQTNNLAVTFMNIVKFKAMRERSNCSYLFVDKKILPSITCRCVKAVIELSYCSICLIDITMFNTVRSESHCVPDISMCT